MVFTSVATALELLGWLESHPRLTSPVKDQIQTLQLELRFLNMFFSSLSTWDVAADDFRAVLVNIEATLAEAGKGLYAAGIVAIQKRKHRTWDRLASKLLEIVEQSKLEIREICIHLLHSSLQCKSSTSSEILQFIDAILKCLKDLVSSKANNVAPLKEQIAVLEEKLIFFRNLVDFTAKRCNNLKMLRCFIIHVQDWANKAACLSFLYWVDQTEDYQEKASKFSLMLYELLQKIKPCTPEVTGIYLGVMKASNSMRAEYFLMGEIIASFVDFLLENLVVPMEDGKELLHEGLVFLITFLMDPPTKELYTWDEKLIFQKADVVISEAGSLICSLSAVEMNEDIDKERDIALRSYLKEISIFRTKVREQYVHILQSPWPNFPRTNVLGFIDFFLGNLKEMLKCDANLIPFAKQQIMKIQEELISVRTFLKGMELQNENEELEDLQMRVISVAYQSEFVIDSCTIKDAPIWYNMILLFDVIKDVKFIKTQMKTIADKQMHNIRNIDAKLSSGSVLPVQSSTSSEVVGFKDETRAIIDRLIGGSTQLDIVPIIGMPGLGKTTLAKNVYNDPSIRYHFHRCAWCCVTQIYNHRDLTHEILNEVIMVDDRISNMREEELDELLYKCLKGHRYLIVIDDIWDIRAWEELKGSFPNDDMGSRIIFTSRIQKVALHAKPDCNLHLLRLLSDEESWELLKMKLFHKDVCPPNFLSVGMQIARNCNGLPLAIVVIAGLLSKSLENLNWWKQIARSTGSQIASEGYMYLFELSYNHLPDFLKPCFLYLGAFRQDKVITVRKLILLWIAEGFVERCQMKSLKDVAEEYLMDLIDRSLVIVTHSSSNGGIKACYMHDLIRDLCLKKAREENFLQLVNDSHYLPKTKYERYRLCIHAEWRPFLESNPIAPCVRSLLFSPVNYWNQDPHIPAFFIRFKFLRVLDLEGIQLYNCFPDEIISLVHLRYLAIYGEIRHVPLSIDSLRKLEIFCVERCYSAVELPGSIWNMKRLRHIHVASGAIISLGCYEVEESAQLDNVDTFACPFLSDGIDTEKLLHRIPKVQKLRCQVSESFNHFPALHSLSRLKSLNVTYIGEVLFPFALTLPLTLKKLTLSEFRLPWCEISAIQKLPNLEVLKLLSDAFQGQRWDIEEMEFLKLKFLKLDNLNVAEWSSSTDSFSCLERLVLVRCRNLETIPSVFGEISTLRTIEVRRCSEKVCNSAKQILEEQLDVGNEGFKVVISDDISESLLRKSIFYDWDEGPEGEFLQVEGQGL